MLGQGSGNGKRGTVEGREAQRRMSVTKRGETAMIR